MASKASFPSLLDGPGFHRVDLQWLKSNCADRFPNSNTRNRLLDSLEMACGLIEGARIPSDLWVDGSFLTRKIDPGDIDVALVVPSHIITALTVEARTVLVWIASDATKSQFGINGFVLTKFADEDPMFPLWEANRQKFQLLFGTEHDDVTPKGIALLKFFGGA